MMFNDENKGDTNNQGALSGSDNYPYSGGSNKKNWIIALLFLILAFIILFIAIYKPEIFDNVQPERVGVNSEETPILPKTEVKDSAPIAVDLPMAGTREKQEVPSAGKSTATPEPTSSSPKKAAVQSPKPPTPVIKNPPVEKVQSVKTDSNPVSGFHLIAGVFLSEKNAGRCIDHLKEKGYVPEILFTRAELNYVSIFTASTLPEAKNKAATIHDIEVWILKR